jgi:metallo-beta-lactamase family protein
MSDPTPAYLTFHGGVDTVTGSRFLLERRRSRILLDCGMFQGGQEMRARNWAEPPFAPQSIDAVVLSHAHLDHSGYLPVLVRRGFIGPIYCTPGSRDLLDVLLHDSARIEEEDAAYANKKGYSRHRPALPLFDTADVDRVLQQVVVRHYHEAFEASPGVQVQFRRAGHILGSAVLELALENGPTLVDVGDLGRWDQPILRDPEASEGGDVVLVESTYGDRVHPTGAVDQLVACIDSALKRNGPLLIPAFAVGRTQALIWILNELEESGRIPHLPIYIDSPMANRVTEVTCQHRDDLDGLMRRAMDEQRCPLCSKRYHRVATKEDSIALNDLEGTFLLIAGSGMLTGGRMLHHLRRRLPDERTTVLMTSFQPQGTRGRQLLEKASVVNIHGEDVRVRAQVEVIEGLSAHGDREDILRWLSMMKRAPKRVYVIHGEPTPARMLAEAITSRFGWSAEVAHYGQRVALDS